MKIKLQDLAAALARSDRQQGYVDIRRGTIVILKDMNEEEALDHAFDVADDLEHYLPLPNAIDEHERTLMQGFAEAQEKAAVRERLLDCLAGAGAASRFHRQVKRLLLRQAWESYLAKQMLNIARDFCEENALEYED